MVGQNRQLRLIRINATADNKLDLATEKVLINIVGSKSDTWNSGGPVQFDKHGDLWIAVGNNSQDLEPGACKVMSTTDSSASSEWGGEYWADRFEQQGNAALAAEYRDTAKVLPEIYVKGESSNFSIAVHPTRRWLASGTVNYATTNDEFNITGTPLFSGYPYFHRDNQKTCPHSISVSAPMNNSPFNNGVKRLPPAVGGTLNNHVNVSIGGPLYAFDPSLRSEPNLFPGAAQLHPSHVRPGGRPVRPQLLGRLRSIHQSRRHARDLCGHLPDFAFGQEAAGRGALPEHLDNRPDLGGGGAGRPPGDLALSRRSPAPPDFRAGSRGIEGENRPGRFFTRPAPALSRALRAGRQPEAPGPEPTCHRG